MNSISQYFTLEKVLIYVVIAAVLITFGFIFYLFVLHFTKSIEVSSPVGGENWEIGKTYEITWKSSGVDKVGIVLFKGQEPKWIAKDVIAKLGRFEWKVYPGQPYGDDNWIAVFEYPWKKGNKVAYSDGAFAVVFPELGSCDNLAIENGWPFLPSDYPNLRKVFITRQGFKGNLGGLDGADKKCQEEATSRGFQGKWHAFLGGDSEQELTVKRMQQTPRKTEGVFVEADAAATLIRGATCHRLLGKNINEFFDKLSSLVIIDQGKLSAGFLNDLKNVWLGRVDGSSPENCTTIASVIKEPNRPLAEKYSFTTTCQNWTKDTKLSDGYPVPFGVSKPPFPRCYTKEGKATDAVGVGALVTGLTGGANNVNAFETQGGYCDTARKLICIEE
jgi:hypothetical protein